MKALLIIDVQNGLIRNKKLYQEEILINTINGKIREIRNNGDLVVFIQHQNKQLIPETQGWEIDERLLKEEHDIIIQKQHGNAFEKTELKSVLDKNNIREVIVCGLVSHGCIQATCIGSLKEGFKTNLLSNGHTNWNRDARDKISTTEKELKGMGVLLV